MINGEIPLPERWKKPGRECDIHGCWKSVTERRTFLLPGVIKSKRHNKLVVTVSLCQKHFDSIEELESEEGGLKI